MKNRNKSPELLIAEAIRLTADVDRLLREAVNPAQGNLEITFTRLGQAIDAATQLHHKIVFTGWLMKSGQHARNPEDFKA